jgi:DNA polymerase III epsilon subunit-like protein
MRFKSFVLNEKKYHSGMDFSDVQESIKGKTLIFLDTETTGIDPNIKYVQITEIAGVAYDDQGNELDTFHKKTHLNDNVKKVIKWEKKNDKPFTGRMTVDQLLKMTGYEDQNAEFGEEKEVLNEFKSWVESFPNPMLIAQNLEFDMKQLGTKVGAPKVVGTQDTLLFARIFMEAIMDSLRGNEEIEKAREIMTVIKKNRWGKDYKKLSHTLDKLGQVFDVKTDMWHSAIADTQQLAGIFYAMLDWYDRNKEQLDPEKYSKTLRKKISKDIGFNKWQKKMQRGDSKKRKDANKKFDQEFGEQTNRDNTHDRDGVNAKLRQHDLKSKQDHNAISHMSRDFGSNDGAWEDVKKESEHEELEELFKVYNWTGADDNDEDDMFNDFHFTTDDGYEYKTWIDQSHSPDDAPAYDIGFTVKSEASPVDSQITLNDTDATNVIATVLDIVNTSIKKPEFWMVFSPTKDDKSQDAKESKRASVYQRMIARAAKKIGQEILDTKMDHDNIYIKVRQPVNEAELNEMPMKMDIESRPLVAKWGPSKWMHEVNWLPRIIGTHNGISFVAGKGMMNMVAIGALNEAQDGITCMAKTFNVTVMGEEGPEAKVPKIIEIGTDPEYRGKGIAAALHEFCIDTFGGVASDNALFESKPGANDGMVGMWTKKLPAKYPCYVCDGSGNIIDVWNGGELDGNEETILVAMKNPAAFGEPKTESKKYRFAKFIESKQSKLEL